MNSRKIKNGLVSVIIPLFGDFDSAGVEMCIDSIKSQRGVDLEIVVVEQTKVSQLADMKNITYKHIPVTKSEDGFFMPGRVRNHAVKISSGEFIYNSDSDILFLDRSYLKRLMYMLQKSERLCFYQPPMKRLPLENLEEFKKRFREGGLQSAVSTLDFSQPYGATYPNNSIRIRHFKKTLSSGEEEISVATETDHRRYLSGQNKGKEPFFYTLQVHAGGTLMRQNQFFSVGGYCEDYAGWGCHDEDIQWKLCSAFDLQRIPEGVEFETLHLDHPRQYFSEIRWGKNREIQTRRKEAGVENAIKYDQLNLRGQDEG